jgi:Flp pilus assembly protein TadG
MRLLRNVLLPLAHCTSGTASLEAAVILPIAISLMAGGIEFGRVYSVYSTADKSMRDAARYLARVCDPSSSGACTSAAAVCDWGLTDAANLAVYGKINPILTGNSKDQPLISGWSTTPSTGLQRGNITLAQPTDCSTLPTKIRLEASGPFTTAMLSASTAVFGGLGLSNTVTLHVNHEERWIGQ